jgi:hypothetical protein
MTNETGHAALHNATNAALNTLASTLDKKVIDIERHGAVGDGVTENSVAFASAFAENTATHIPVWIPPGVYRITSPLVVPSRMIMTGAGHSHSIIYGDGCGVLSMGGEPKQDYTFADIRFRGAGATLWHFDDWLTRAQVYRCLFQQLSADQLIFSNTGGLEQTEFDYCSFTVPKNATNGAIQLTGGASLIQNVWRNCITTTCGADHWFFDLNDTYRWVYGNAWINCRFNAYKDSVTPGGFIRLRSAESCLIERCGVYDLQTDTYRNDLIWIGTDLTGGMVSVHNSIKQFRRYAQALAVGVYDVNIDAAEYTLVEQCGGNPAWLFKWRDNGTNTVTVATPAADV